jgi:hypothetical protein
MSVSIKITAGSVQVDAELNDSPTARVIAQALPIKGSVRRWGEEIYFSIPVQAELEPDAREVVEVGELGYWPTGSAFCLFFGPTPASRGDEIRAASAVNIIGTMKGDFAGLSTVTDGEPILIDVLTGTC